MQVPLQISFHRLDHSDALEATIRRKVEQLEKFCDRITSVRVTVSLSGERQQQGKLYSVKIDMTLPGNDIIVDREPPLHQAHQDPYVAVRDAFRSARRQLEDYVRKTYRKKKRSRIRMSMGRVFHLLLENNGGFIRSEDGREIYFNRSSVLGQGFDHLALGDEVRFVEEMGENGPQASSVEVIGKWGKHGLTPSNPPLPNVPI